MEKKLNFSECKWQFENLCRNCQFNSIFYAWYCSDLFFLTFVSSISMWIDVHSQILHTAVFKELLKLLRKEHIIAWGRILSLPFCFTFISINHRFDNFFFSRSHISAFHLLPRIYFVVIHSTNEHTHMHISYRVINYYFICFNCRFFPSLPLHIGLWAFLFVRHLKE